MINDVICVLSEDLIWFIYISPFFAEDDEGWSCGGQGRQEKGKLAKRMKGVYIWTGNIHIKKRNRGLEDNWKKISFPICRELFIFSCIWWSIFSRRARFVEQIMSRDVIALVGLQCAINYRRVEHIVGFLPLQYMKTKSSLLRQTPQSSNQPSIARAQVSLLLALSAAAFYDS